MGCRAVFKRPSLNNSAKRASWLGQIYLTLNPFHMIKPSTKVEIQPPENAFKCFQCGKIFNTECGRFLDIMEHDKPWPWNKASNRFCCNKCRREGLRNTWIMVVLCLMISLFFIWMIYQ